MPNPLARITSNIWEKSTTVSVRADQAITRRWAATITTIVTTVPITKRQATIVTAATTSRTSPNIRPTTWQGTIVIPTLVHAIDLGKVALDCTQWEVCVVEKIRRCPRPITCVAICTAHTRKTVGNITHTSHSVRMDRRSNAIDTQVHWQVAVIILTDVGIDVRLKSCDDIGIFGLLNVA